MALLKKKKQTTATDQQQQPQQQPQIAFIGKEMPAWQKAQQQQQQPQQPQAVIGAGQPANLQQLSELYSNYLNQQKEQQKPKYLQKGGYVDSSTGEYIPPKNITKVKFNDDGTIDYTPKGTDETIRLTKEEYGALIGDKGETKTTDKVLKIKYLESPEYQQDLLNQQQQQEKERYLNALKSQQQIKPEMLDLLAAEKGLELKDNVVQKVTSVGAGIGGAMAGAKTGATIGSVIGPEGAVVGGVIGGVVGGVAGFIVKTGFDQRQNTKNSFKVYSAAKQNQNFILSQVRQGTISPEQAQQLWDEQKINLLIAERNLKKLTQTDLDKFLSNAGDELITIETYMQRQPYMDNIFAQELAGIPAKNPNNIYPELNYVDLDDYEPE